MNMLQYKNNHFSSNILVAKAQKLSKIVQKGANGHN